MAPNISIRESIRWIPDPFSEPTSTLVLTSAAKRFVDIRVLKDSSLSQHSPSMTEDTDLKPFSALDWAFAGTSSSSVGSPDDNGNAVAHCEWRHWIDNRTGNPEDVVDEGKMYPIEGDGQRSLEKGRMVNPDTGRMTEYEEIWRDVDAVGIPEVVGGEGVEREDEQKVSAVLILDEPEQRARGMVIRIGQYCQGVLRVKGEFSLERWEWAGKEKGWERKVRMGSLFLPCGPAMDILGMQVGIQVKHGDFRWEVVELDYF
ncbi:hypothetical protein KC367_g6737 [Hortaea werneckii]|uniref:Protein HRI1 n=1 Tax=Hortaea werneckii TaxID=91943 RepID=A0A3M7IA14_HORWE|nr:hypothetical protein KC358_g13124 [Hortaea werneckii]KAI6809721.1 hypothetical protein KC350_g12814 [Hortaea werneckii]KAI6839813.1 hypothetical protein KC342_g3253 [Hortaea werneckii]KAI6902724.1 hypothetical protein KC348_g15973 [Hortaea werneckii]KAI6925980.1 hypothetical protein KC341_g13066 [Hortaea werneckii]